MDGRTWTPGVLVSERNRTVSRLPQPETSVSAKGKRCPKPPNNRLASATRALRARETAGVRGVPRGQNTWCPASLACPRNTIKARTCTLTKPRRAPRAPPTRPPRPPRLEPRVARLPAEVASRLPE
eukprot:3934200-Prymnesium_polylepis.1